jgi:integrase
VQALREHRTRQKEERLLVGPEWQELDLVFTDAFGGPISRRDLTRSSFAPLLKRANLPHIRFHDLRHTAATLALLQKVPVKVVSEMLGHASVAITLDIYSHVLPSMQEDAAAAMEAALWR